MSTCSKLKFKPGGCWLPFMSLLGVGKLLRWSFSSGPGRSSSSASPLTRVVVVVVSTSQKSPVSDVEGDWD